jgi:hypothetical protein
MTALVKEGREALLMACAVDGSIAFHDLTLLRHTVSAVRFLSLSARTA